MQVPIAVALDAVLGHPAWMRATGSAVLTFVGGAVVLLGFFGINAEASLELPAAEEEQRRLQWEHQSAVLQEQLEVGEEAEALAATSNRPDGGRS